MDQKTSEKGFWNEQDMFLSQQKPKMEVNLHEKRIVHKKRNLKYRKSG